MAELIWTFDTQLRGPDHHRYTVRVNGRERPDQLWEGWLEFLPLGGGQPVVTGRETTQPNRDDLVYWASGLTDPYLDGALIRALRPSDEMPRFEGDRPAGSAPEPHAANGAPAGPLPAAVLDPFHVYAEGDVVLRSQLNALTPTHLRSIVNAYPIADLEAHELERATKPELIGLIMAAAERNAAKNAGSESR